MFAECRTQGRGAVMPFVVGGHPVGTPLGDLLRGLESAGADAVEIGIPFSDPIADGPVIAAAMHEALVAGASVESVLAEVQSARSSVGIPLVAMVSVSIVDRLGGPAFLDRLAAVGFDGVIVPDADLDGVDALRDAAARLDLAFTTLIAPDTSASRAAEIARGARGFVYVLARRGLTGERQDAPDITDRMASLRAVTELPLVAGFGISTSEHVAAVLADADGAIVGSALVRCLADASRDGADAVEAATSVVEPLARATRAGR